MSKDAPRNDNEANDEPEDITTRIVELERVEALLAHGHIADIHGTMLWGSNYAALVTVSDDELEATAVYKPQRGERPLWDFPNGTLCYREVLAYEVSKVLDWTLVPPTVLREGPHGLGSLQLFIDHDPEINYFSLDDRFVDQLKRFALFDAVINNTDRKGGHLLMDERGKLWGIDHGLTFHTMPKLRTVIWEFAEQPITQPLQHAVRHLITEVESCESKIRRELDRLLSPAEIAALLRRSYQLLERKTYPKPGPGPNHPWPPV